MAFLHALVASASICFVPTAPLVVSSSNASTTASPTVSTFNGLSAMAPRKLSRLPNNELNSEATKPPKAIGNVNFRLESYMKAGRIKILRNSGKVAVIVFSASRLVVMYLDGRIGAPAAADINTKAGTFSFEDSWANAMATIKESASALHSNEQSVTYPSLYSSAHRSIDHPFPSAPELLPPSATKDSDFLV